MVKIALKKMSIIYIYIMMDIDDICITFKKSNNKFDHQTEFFKTNYNIIYMTMGVKENKLYYDSYQELKTDVEWLCEHVY